ncbi:MAG: hypothetical protein H5T38_00905 [Methanobacteriaceae archaeon]|nr:hypothetical protein [Methanobacteriaceae archaeon]HHW05484.1 hypothetical protein [Methanothermobacter sp.]HPQ04455.1 hypothetical protein [Methanothermobacter sp.]
MEAKKVYAGGLGFQLTHRKTKKGERISKTSMPKILVNDFKVMPPSSVYPNSIEDRKTI